MWLFLLMTAVFAAAVMVMHLVPSGKKLWGFPPTPSVIKPRSLVLFKVALDAAVTCMLLLYWWWDPMHRHDFLNVPRLVNAFSWVRFDNACVREGGECEFGDTLRFFWHAMFWSSVVTRRWWPWVDPCVSSTRATVEKCVPQNCDEKGMCECIGYTDLRVMWSVIGLDVLTIAVAMAVLLLAGMVRRTLFRSPPFLKFGHVLVRGATFMVIAFAVRLVIEMGNMLFEADVSLASTHLPPSVASAINRCDAANSALDIIASCVKSSSTASATKAAGAGSDDAGVGTVPKTVGKLIVLQAQTTTSIVTGMVMAGMLLKWVVNRIRKQETAEEAVEEEQAANSGDEEEEDSGDEAKSDEEVQSGDEAKSDEEVQSGDEDEEESDAEESDAEESDAEETDAEETDAEETDAEETDAEEGEGEEEEEEGRDLDEVMEAAPMLEKSKEALGAEATEKLKEVAEKNEKAMEAADAEQDKIEDIKEKIEAEDDPKKLEKLNEELDEVTEKKKTIDAEIEQNRKEGDAEAVYDKAMASLGANEENLTKQKAALSENTTQAEQDLKDASDKKARAEGEVADLKQKVADAERAEQKVKDVEEKIKKSEQALNAARAENPPDVNKIKGLQTQLMGLKTTAKQARDQVGALGESSAFRMKLQAKETELREGAALIQSLQEKVEAGRKQLQSVDGSLMVVRRNKDLVNAALSDLRVSDPTRMAQKRADEIREGQKTHDARLAEIDGLLKQGDLDPVRRKALEAEAGALKRIKAAAGAELDVAEKTVKDLTEMDKKRAAGEMSYKQFATEAGRAQKMREAETALARSRQEAADAEEAAKKKRADMGATAAEIDALKKKMNDPNTSPEEKKRLQGEMKDKQEALKRMDAEVVDLETKALDAKDSADKAEVGLKKTKKAVEKAKKKEAKQAKKDLKAKKKRLNRRKRINAIKNAPKKAAKGLAKGAKNAAKGVAEGTKNAAKGVAEGLKKAASRSRSRKPR